MTTLSEVVESYRNYLLHHQAAHPQQQALKRFDQRLAAHPEAAHAEAATFQFLRTNDLHPVLLEDASAGGPDFRCDVYGAQLIVEVTALGNEALTSASGMTHDLDSLGTGFINMPAVIVRLRRRVSSKVRQISGFDCPRVLVIASEHPGSSIFLSQIGIEEFMTGGSTISVPVSPDGPAGDAYLSTDLAEAAFIRPSKTGGFETCRESYSAFLMMAIDGAGCLVLGMLHPEPLHELPRDFLPSVPFARLEWPIRENRMNVEWVIRKVTGLRHGFSTIRITDTELREGIN